MSRSAADRLKDLTARHGEKVRYLVAGTVNTVFAYGLFLLLLAILGAKAPVLSESPVWLLRELGRNYYLVAQWTAWALGIPISTLMMKYYVFRSSGGSFLRQLSRSYSVYLPAQGLSFLLLWFAVEVLGMLPQLGQLIAVGLTTILSYLGHKHFTFGKTSGTDEVTPGDFAEKD